MRKVTPRSALLVLGMFAVLGTASCTDLTETPYNEVTPQNFHPTAQDVAALMGAVYAPLRSIWMGWYGQIDGQGEVGDILLTPNRPNGWYDGGVYLRNHEHTWDNRRGQDVSLWGEAYGGITSANRVIYQIQNGIAPVAADKQPAVIAELKAIRAYYYDLLMDDFGNIPITTDFADTTLPSQVTRTQAFDFVTSQLDSVIPLLSTETGAATYGRMNKWAAEAILARVYLNAGVYTGTTHYDKVITLCNDIINSGKYQLASTYREPFSENNQNSTENIWDVPYDQVNAPGSNFHMKTLKPELRFVFNMAAQPWGGSAANPQFIDTYDSADTRMDGTPADNGRGGTWLSGPQFTPDHTYGYNFINYVPAYYLPPGDPNLAFNTGYPVWKYEIYAGETGSSNVDYPIVRYAEVLMMKAEALLRTGHPDEAAQIVTQVRQRDFAQTDPAKATVTGAQLQEGSSFNYGWYGEDGVTKDKKGGTPITNGGADIQYGRFLDELGWEFAAEGHRRMDMIRFGVFTTKMWFNHNPDGDTHTRIFPIPYGALNTNPNLKQNPGY